MFFERYRNERCQDCPPGVFPWCERITFGYQNDYQRYNDYHGKRTISKDEATAHGLFEGRETVGCVKLLTVFSENSLKKPCKIEKMSKNQGRNH